MKHAMHYGVAIITGVVLLVVAVANDSVDCNDPNTWSTSVGVQACAINGGK